MRPEQLFLRAAATLDQLRQTRRRQTRALGAGLRQTRLDPMREREVHVVAAEHQMVAHADAREFRLTVAHAHFDQREVGGAAADVADQHELCVSQLGCKAFAMMKQPVVERGLRFFQQP